MGILDFLNTLGRRETPQIAGLRTVKRNRAGSFSATGGVISVPGGSTNTPGKITLVSKVVPAGAAAELDSWSANVIDVGNSNQIYFAILRNGNPVAPNVNRVSGEVFGASQILDIKEALYPGTIEIVAYNISGMSTTIEADALPAAVAIRCQAWFTGSLLSERGGY
jgi:hypothetical protein